MKKIFVLLGVLFLLLPCSAFAESPAERTVTVEPGDTLWGLAEKYSGYGANWPELAEINGGTVIYPGQELDIPDGWPTFYSLDVEQLLKLEGTRGHEDMVFQAKQSSRVYKPASCLSARFPNPTGRLLSVKMGESSTSLKISFPVREKAVVWPMGVVWDPQGGGSLLTQGYESALNGGGGCDCVLSSTSGMPAPVPHGLLEEGASWEGLRFSAYYEKGTAWFWGFIPQLHEGEIVIDVIMALVCGLEFQPEMPMPKIGDLELIDPSVIDWVPGEEITIVDVQEKWRWNIPELREGDGWMPWSIAQRVWHPVVRRANGSELLLDQWGALFLRDCVKEEGCVNVSVTILPEHIGTVWQFARLIPSPLFKKQ